MSCDPRGGSQPKRVLSLLLCTGALLLPCQVGADEPRVRERQSLADLLDSKSPGLQPKSDQVGLLDSSIPGGKSSLILVAVVASVGLVWLVRRRKARGMTVGEADVIQVVGRALLSHKHAVFLLQSGGKRVLVGVAGDRMTALGSFEAEPAPGEAEASARDSKPRSGFTGCPEGRDAVASARSVSTTELLPYRKQMERLRGMLREMRSDGGTEGASGES